MMQLKLNTCSHHATVHLLGRTRESKGTTGIEDIFRKGFVVELDRRVRIIRKLDHRFQVHQKKVDVATLETHQYLKKFKLKRNLSEMPMRRNNSEKGKYIEDLCYIVCGHRTKDDIVKIIELFEWLDISWIALSKNNL